MTECKQIQIEFIKQKHGDQKDLVGEAYWTHPYRVSVFAKRLLWSALNEGLHYDELYDDVHNVAMCHDLLEDTNTTIDELKELGLSDVAIYALKLCTRSKHEQYETYIDRIGTNFIATIVKLADLIDNLDVLRFAGVRELNERDLKRINKYLSAYSKLTERLKELKS